MTNRLTEGKVGLQLFKLTLPMMWGFFTLFAFTLADTFFVGQLGTQQLAAMTFTFPVIMVLESVAIGLGTGASSVIARAIGEGDRYKVKSLTTNSLILSVLIVTVLVFLGLITTKPLFQALGAAEEVLPLIEDYMNIWYLGMIFLVVPMVGNNAIRAAGNTIVPSTIITVAAFVNIALDPILIFGLGGFPRLEIQGAALATLIARATTMAASLIFLHFREKMLLLALPNAKEVWQSWKSILHVGIPAAATYTIIPVSIGFITSLIAVYGDEAIAGFGIASRVEGFATLTLFALSASMAPFVGQNWGAKKYSRIDRALQLSFQFCLFWGTFVAIVFAFGAYGIASMFESNPNVVKTAATYLTIVPVSYIALGIVFVCSSAFNALGKPLPSVIMNLTRMLVLYVPLAYLGSWLFGINGIFVSACLSNLIVGIGTFIWNQKNFKPTYNSKATSVF